MLDVAIDAPCNYFQLTQYKLKAVYDNRICITKKVKRAGANRTGANKALDVPYVEQRGQAIFKQSSDILFWIVQINSIAKFSNKAFYLFL